LASTCFKGDAVLPFDLPYQFMYVSAMPTDEKSLEWIGSSHKDLMALPADVRRLFGFALSLAQVGDKHDAAQKLPKRVSRRCGNENPNC
jgi:hypothetical protein